MGAISRDIRSRLEGGATRAFDALGYSGRAASEAKRDTWWWLQARAQALRTRRGLVSGCAVAWTNSGYAELVPIDVVRPGPGEVTVRVEVSAVSPGTERAHYLHLPNTAPMWLPGYSAAGTVIAVGPGVSTARIGDRVAASGVGHASVATVPGGSVYRLPDEVSFEAGALVQLGVICGQGVEKCELKPGERVAVVGSGAIGALAQRLAAAAGAEVVAAIARSRAKEAIARRSGVAEFLVSGRDDERIASLEAPVVIEAAGSPEGVNVAIAAAATSGRVVLLGSPRGVTHDLAVDQIRDKRLTLIGAHVNTLALGTGRDAAEQRRLLATRFLEAVADGMPVDDLTGPPLDPREAGAFYRELAADGSLVGAHFDWSSLDAGTRAGRGKFARVPNLLARGVDPARPPMRNGRSAAAALLELGDPFAGAEGRLRVGILGCGDIAHTNAAAIRAAPNVELTACYDPDPRLAAQLATRFGGTACATDEALLDRSDVDAVLISVPHHLHAPVAIAAARAGKHVVVEKPPANQLAEAERMISAAEDADVMLTVCFPDRYAPGAVVARRAIESGALGEVAGMTVKFFRDKAPMYWIGGFSGRSASDWRRVREKAGGGVLIMNLSHYVDLLVHLTGLEVASVAAVMASTEAVTEVEDLVSLSLRFDNGAVGNISGGSAVRGDESTSFGIWGREGHVMLEPDFRLFSLRAAAGGSTARWQALPAHPPVNTRAVFLSRFATAVERQVEPDVSPAQALAVQSVLEAAYESDRSGSFVQPAALRPAGRS